MAIATMILSVLAGLGATLLMLVLLMAAAPNSSDAQAQRLKWIAISVCVVAALGVIGAVWAAVQGRAWLGAGIGLLPAAYCVGVLVVMLIVERA